MDLSNGKTVSEFHHYLLPTEYPILSSFCKELTGISQVNAWPRPQALFLFFVLREPGVSMTTKYGIRNGIWNGIWNGYGMMSIAQ